MTHRCAATRCPAHIPDVEVLCRPHAEIASRELHLALMAAQMHCGGPNGANARVIYDKRMAEAQLKINEQEGIKK